MLLRNKISVLLFAAGVFLYLMISDAPAAVHWVSVPLQMAILLSVSAVAWSQASRRVRLLGIIFIGLIGGIVWTYISSFVISALNPLQLIYFVAGSLGILVEVLAFLGCVWFIEMLLTKLGLEKSVDAR